MRVLVAAGGTGGHVYPALAVLDELRARGALSGAGWVGNPTGVEATVARQRPWIEFFPLRSRGIDRHRPWTWPMALAQAAGGLLRAVTIVRRFRPDVVLGTGGHAAFSPLVAAWLHRVPIAVQEQNARMGLSNRLLSRIADLVLLSFPTTRGVPRRAKACVTGNPVRQEVTALSPQLGDELLVVGGSLGSRRLVDAIVRAAPDLARAPGLRMRLVVGRAAPAEEVATALAQAGVAAEVVRYVEPFADALSRARLVVARAGATTVAEVAAAGRPAVFVPWDGAAGHHQHDNARAIAEGGGCLIATDGTALWDLGRLVRELWGDGERLRRMAAAARAVARPDAARRAAAAIIALVEEKRT
ncbi:UDP-N-acetylglucosamine--N-acetylmuramyl-(pentapeptide) pyrophosphoryl-undecaprenol N-acetylglucosamine transferase [Candidatus Bipolaricaulota bacterium]|nr:UDP-N-acetylglucosamine--N-acetylmuramyl-(pentapeptide) pyrophosphoryl-undecaprenol N-acetylglucosamine transferase [Candidatus Bipolaricaulota bacterium]